MLWLSGGIWWLGLGIVNAVLGSTGWVLRAQSQKKRPKKTRWGNKSAFFIYCFPIFNLRHQALIKGPTWLILWSGGKEGKLWNHISNNVCPHRMIATGDIIGSTWPVGYQEKERRGQWGNHILPIFMIFQFASVELRVLLMIRRRRGEVKCWNQLSITFHLCFQILQLETSGSHLRSHLTWWWSGEGGEGGGGSGITWVQPLRSSCRQPIGFQMETYLPAPGITLSVPPYLTCTHSQNHLISACEVQLQTTNCISKENISWGIIIPMVICII